jgi:hypothetical protein
MSSVEDLEGQATAQRAAPRAVTPRSQLHARPRARAERAEHYLLGRAHGEYTADDIRVIVAHYYETAQPVGLDPLLVIAQMALETGGLTSFWSQRPRRNPAGIGVTGAPGAGVSFPSWKIAVRAHTGRLLAYSLHRGDEDQLQRHLIDEALTHRALPDRFRGVAPRLEGLAGTWAADLQYAVKLARVANEIRAQDL